MKSAWKLLRVFWAMSTRTPYVSFRARLQSRDEDLRYRAHRIQVGCSLLCDILGVSVRVRGSVPSRGGMLVVSNHFGMLDPLILSTVLPSAPVGKAEMLDWPFVGWVSAVHGLIPVDRRRRSTVSRFTERVRERLDAGVNVVVFPEGTTTASLQVRRFKTGAFEAVADRDGGAVLPVYLTVRSVEGQAADENVRQRVVWADGGASFVEHALDLASIRQMSFTVYVGRPIPTAGRDRKELAQLAREAVEALRLHGETGETIDT